MRKEGGAMRDLTITPMELYFLGKLLGARYIDYGYIAAMPDITKRPAIREQETLELLEDEGLIETDFSGDAEVMPEVADFLHPVLFSGREARLRIGEAVHTFHLEDGRAVEGTLDGGTIAFHEVSDQDIYALLAGGDAAVIQLADVRTGYSRKEYGEDELLDAKACAQAVALLKGAA